MASEVVIQYAEKIADLTLHGTVIKGNVIAHDGTGWVQADASDATTNLYAQYLAMQGGVSGSIIKGCKGCVLYDADAPYTANGALYVSGTAGALTHTRPATAADVIQVVGRAIDTYSARIDITPPKSLEVFIPPCTYDSTTEPGLGVIDSPVWVGPAMDSITSEAVYFQGRIPSGAISCDSAKIIWNSIGESTMTVAASIICCADGATNTGDTGTAYSATAPTSLADNKICYNDIYASFDADAFKPGYNFSVKAYAQGTVAGDLQAIGLIMRYTVVGDPGYEGERGANNPPLSKI